MTPDAVRILADAVSDFAKKLLLVAEAMTAIQPEEDWPEPPPTDDEPPITEPPPEAEAAAEPETEDSGYLEDDVRRVLGKKSQAGFTAQCKALITKYGANTVSTLDPKHYAAIIAEAEAIK